MPNKFFSPSSLRLLTVCLLLVLAILLFILNLFPHNSQGDTSNTATATGLATMFVQQTATAIAKSATQVSATETAIVKTPTTLITAPVELHLMISDPQGLIKNTTSAQKSITDQVQANSKLNGQQAALVMVYVGVDDQSKIMNAQTIANNIEGILLNLSKDTTFVKSVYRSVIYVGTVTTINNKTLTGTSDLSAADLEIYLYSTP